MSDTDHDHELIPIPLDRDTRELLVAFARACGKRPAEIAAEIVRDVLRDDAAAHQTRLLN